MTSAKLINKLRYISVTVTKIHDHTRNNDKLASIPLQQNE